MLDRLTRPKSKPDRAVLYLNHGDFSPPPLHIITLKIAINQALELFQISKPKMRVHAIATCAGEAGPYRRRTLSCESGKNVRTANEVKRRWKPEMGLLQLMTMMPSATERKKEDEMAGVERCDGREMLELQNAFADGS